jgi:signal transduction histidine kinase
LLLDSRSLARLRAGWQREDLACHQAKPYRGLAKRFGDLAVRPKLIVLHNLFFLVLTSAVYFSVIPPFERRVAAAKTIEVSIITQVFAEDRPLDRLPKIDGYDYREGTAEQLGIPGHIKVWLDEHPGQIWQNEKESDYLYRKDPKTGLYRRITLPSRMYDAVLQRAKVTLFAVLGVIYVLAVLLLELIIMPRYVYQPLSLMLNADRATQANDREHEIIPDELIPGDEIGQIMRSRNATVRKLREQEAHLESKNRMLEAQDRLASLGLLSASVAHELNTPLAVLHGSVEKLLETVREGPAQERLQRMLRVTRRLQSISAALLDFARQRRQQTESVPLRTLVEEAWSLVAIDERAAQVHFSNEVPAELQVTGNADRLIQVFVNLLRNAMHAVSPGGHIWVRGRGVEREGAPWVSIVVEDDGPGIPPDVLPDIFDAFVTSRLDSKGTGLGLTVAQGIVQQHGGTIAASNRPGGGARLEVLLPKEAAPAAAV